MAIIKSLLDNDFYKFTMGAFVLRYYPEAVVRFAFKNRTSQVPMVNVIDEKRLREELEVVRKLRFQPHELEYLRNLAIDGEAVFTEEYIDYLKDFRLPEFDLKVNEWQFELEFTGKWPAVIYWETIALAIINQLYYEALEVNMTEAQKTEMYAKAADRLQRKIDLIKERPSIKFSDFGYRRRHSAEWHEYVVKTLADQLPNQFLGASSVEMARKNNVAPIGTMAHELFMVAVRIGEDTNEALEAGHNRVLNQWWEMYGRKLSVALTDTYGTEYFFENVPIQVAKEWKALRQDSGDPLEFGEKMLKFYEKHSVKNTPTAVFSDGLDIDQILEIDDYFQDRLNSVFGWGTLLTNDFRGLHPENNPLYRPLSIVIKAKEVNGRGVVKLSDNPAKAMGQEADIERYKRVFKYRDGEYAECTV